MKTSALIQAAALAIFAAAIAATSSPAAAPSEPQFNGQHYRGRGDVEYLRLLDTAARMFEPDPELQNLAMLYEPKWDGLVEGPTWDAWWIQNSYGTTYSILPLLREPFVTFLQHSQDLWFDQMGDGHRNGDAKHFSWVAPDGCLCDCAQPGRIIYKQGDGRTAIHDWGMEFTAAGVLLQSELLLISRDPGALAHYLPRLERSANFIETRRDPTNNLFLAGPAGNLLAPSYAGWHRPDGSYGQACLAGLSITYIAALDRLIELEKLAHNSALLSLYTSRRDLAKQGLPLLTTGEGCFIRSLDPDGVKHGVFGAQAHGYFEASPNHDAIAFRVADDAQSERIYRKIVSLPGLRPYDFVLPNYPSYDDMYEKPEGLWAYGTWVNGGHWSTCEARMVLAYCRLGQFEDARRSMRRLLTFAERFRMDNPLTKFGSDVYQPTLPINLCYDTFGPAAAFMRGLFEYLYRADGLTLIPHIPPAIEELQQLDPVRFGQKELLLTTLGRGPVTGVRVNGRQWKHFDSASVFLPYDKTPAVAHVQILLGRASLNSGRASVPASQPTGRANVLVSQPSADPPASVAKEGQGTDLAALDQRVGPLREFHRRLAAAALGETPAAARVQLALDCIKTAHRRQQLLQTGKIKPLPGPAEAAADQSYLETAQKVCAGLDAFLKSGETAADPASRKIYRLWREVSH
jgi:hypothetical protein